MSADPTMDFLNAAASSSSSSAAPQDPTLAFLESGGKVTPAQVQASNNPAPPRQGSWGEALKGDLDIAHVVAAHAVIDPIAAGARILNQWIPGGDAEPDINAVQKTADEWLGSPLTSAGQYGLQEAGRVIQPVVSGVRQGLINAVGPDWTHAASEVAQALPVVGMAPRLARTVGATARAVTAPVRAVGRGIQDLAAYGTPSAEEILNRAAQESSQSTSAQTASIPIEQTSPAFQQEVQRVARQQGEDGINLDAAQRQAEAESIGTRLSEGQALQDQGRMSNELNGRARNPEWSQFFQWQNGRLKAFFGRLRDAVTDNTGARAASQTDHGDALIQAYQDTDDAARADVDARYTTLRNAYAQYLANGGQKMALDGQTLLGNVQKALHEGIVDPETGERLGGMLTNHAPSGIMQDLQGWAENGMSFEDYEAMRTNLAKLMRGNSVDPLAKASAHVIRSVMEDMPLAQDIQGLKGLADDARGAARARFERINADPAYEAVVNGTADPGQFTKQFVFGPRASRDGLNQMLGNLAKNETARGHITVSALDHLRERTGIDWQGNGTFSQANFNKGLAALEPIRNQVFSPAMQEYLQRMGNVAGNMQRLERGNFVNHSNTWTAAAGAGAQDALETLARHKGGGLVGWALDRRAEAARAAEAARVIRPGAGIDVTGPVKPIEAEPVLPGGVGAAPQPMGSRPTVAAQRGSANPGPRSDGGAPPPPGAPPGSPPPGGSPPPPGGGPGGASASQPGPSATGPAPRKSLLEGLSWDTPAKTAAEHTRRARTVAEAVPEISQAIGPRPGPPPPNAIAAIEKGQRGMTSDQIAQAMANRQPMGAAPAAATAPPPPAEAARAMAQPATRSEAPPPEAEPPHIQGGRRADELNLTDDEVKEIVGKSSVPPGYTPRQLAGLMASNPALLAGIRGNANNPFNMEAARAARAAGTGNLAEAAERDQAEYAATKLEGESFDDWKERKNMEELQRIDKERGIVKPKAPPNMADLLKAAKNATKKP